MWTYLDVSVYFRYGFRRPPHLELKARPKLGERKVTFAHVTDWIENKLNQEFQVGICELNMNTKMFFHGFNYECKNNCIIRSLMHF